MQSEPVGEVVQPLGHRASRIVHIWRAREIVGVRVRLDRDDLMVIRLGMCVRLAADAPERLQAESILRPVRGR